MDDAELRVITGPTAAGKTGLAMRLAERLGAVIVSADSRQIYRRFDIGTAKPTASERERVPHRGVDVVDPTERYSAAAWAAAAARWIDEARSERRDVVIVGGTGFYLRALFAPLFAEPELDPARRASLQRELAALPLSELRRWCAELDPARSNLGRTQLLRAIEIALLTGERLSDMHARDARPARWRPRYLVVDPGPVLRERIASRVDAMFGAGWVEEVQRLSDVPADAPAWNAAGYEAVRDVVRGTSSVAAARERVVIETRQYAKRQRTWLRHQLEGAPALRINPDEQGAFAHAEQWWSGDSA
ncbi:MAG TPA: tRNA (adenosine(37)-N6)-dimethylallyltransferase MiaA [Gemmatimonadaceae bacterium]|nr:tRNA (adenosine(37)-N6)-dimethylallyltransferase MiaA [Gemmatimonadaceae bacterium]